VPDRRPAFRGSANGTGGAQIGLEIHYTRNGSDILPGINITNYEMAENFDAADFDAVVLDESSILKSLDGKDSPAPYGDVCRHALSPMLYATPAPNDIAEIANHAEFLSIMSGLICWQPSSSTTMTAGG